MAFVLHIVSHTVSFNICTFGPICSCVTSRHRPPKQYKTARFRADWLYCTWDFSSHFWLRGSMFFVTCQIQVSRPDSGDFLASTLLLFPLSPSGFFFSVFIFLALGIIRLTSIYMLRCRGDRTSWDFFTSLPLRSFSPSSFLPVLHVWACVIEPYSVILHIMNKV